MNTAIVAPKKLIEVALPLEEINKAAAREKSLRHGHPSTLHLWWARRPLAAARAVLFAQLVNDPSWKYTDEEKKKPQVRSAITRKRNELFRLVAELVQWESTTDEKVLARAARAINDSWIETCEANSGNSDAEVRSIFDPAKLPPCHDPFAGGGTIPAEAQRLGLEARASDLNPVAVLINKALIEIPPKFAGSAPVAPDPSAQMASTRGAGDWPGCSGLAEDVRRYGSVLRDRAYAKVGKLYPEVLVSKEQARKRPDLKALVGETLLPIAWIWARTVASPNPAMGGAHVPLVTSFWLSRKPGKETWIHPVVDGRTYRFEVRTGKPKHVEAVDSGTKEGPRAGFKCLLSGVPISNDYIRAEGSRGRLKARLMAVVAEGTGRRIYLDADEEAEEVARSAKPTWRPGGEVPARLTGGTCHGYGLSTWADLYSSRQLATLCALSDSLDEVGEQVLADAVRAWGPKSAKRAEAYRDAIRLYLAFVIDKCAEALTTICTWSSAPKNELVVSTFRRQALPMTWDWAEANPFGDSSGSVEKVAAAVAKALATTPARGVGTAVQADAQQDEWTSGPAVISSDPPYYDNIGYADLSDFFYVWLRRNVKKVHGDLTGTMLAPKDQELVAAHYRHASRAAAERFFLGGMKQAIGRMAATAHPAFPVTLYYAFKQTEEDDSDDGGASSTGWETFLEAILSSGLAIVGTWPMRTERGGRSIGIGANALASSIILVCRPRKVATEAVSRREFLKELERAMPKALAEMTQDAFASIAPVDLHQASIGPGMAVFSQYPAVLEADGSAMTVKAALVHINKAIDDFFAHAEGDLDADTRFCIGWFQQYGFEEGPFGDADVLARAKGTSVDGVSEAGVVQSGRGKVRLLRVIEYPKKWNPAEDERLPVWEACHQMCRALRESEADAGQLLAGMPEKQDAIRQLAYRLYTLCERKGWAEPARAYNELIASWPALVDASRKAGLKGEQLGLM